MTVEERVRAFIADNFVLASSDGGLGGDDSLMDLGVMDSTGVLEMVAFLEQDFGLDIQDTELLPENLDTINAIVRFVGRKQGSK